VKSTLDAVISNFEVSGDFIKDEKIKCGNINDTYMAIFKSENGSNNRYIVQRINHNVFKEPYKLMENVTAITQHIRKKVIKQGGDPSRETINFVPTQKGEYIYKCDYGNYWRAYNYIGDARTYQIVEDPIHLYNAGKAFGRFQKFLSDFPVKNLYDTIPDFHNTPKRFKVLLDAIDQDQAGRVKSVQSEINFIKKREPELSLISNLLESGQLPLRVTHNDTKFNNVLIDNKSGEGICVIDLDTVMPGSSLYDFGDSIRSGANTSEEDERDLTKISLDLGLFEEFTRGYLELAGEFLTPIEIKYLSFSARLITLELGMRFLTDHINGDVYFKTNYEGHNLVRTRAQFKLVQDMEFKYEKMERVVEKYTNGRFSAVYEDINKNKRALFPAL